MGHLSLFIITSVWLTAILILAAPLGPDEGVEQGWEEEAAKTFESDLAAEHRYLGVSYRIKRKMKVSDRIATFAAQLFASQCSDGPKIQLVVCLLKYGQDS